MSYEKSILVQNDDSVDPKIMGYKGVWVVRAMGYDRVDCSSINFHNGYSGLHGSTEVASATCSGVSIRSKLEVT